MIYHAILGIREGATKAEIEQAYEKKRRTLADSAHKLTPVQQAQKSDELEKARQACLEWRDKNFAERSSERVRRYSADFFSAARAGVCIGPCSCTAEFCDSCWCCGDSAASEGGCTMMGVAVVCDLAIYGVMLGSYLWERKEQRAAEEEKQAREAREAYRADRRRELEELQQQQQACELQLREQKLRRDQAEAKYNQATRYVAFFTALGGEDAFEVLSQKLRERVAEEEREVEKLEKQCDALRAEVRSLSSILS